MGGLGHNGLLSVSVAAHKPKGGVEKERKRDENEHVGTI